MRQSLVLKQQLQESIESEIAQRAQQHRAKMDILRNRDIHLKANGGAVPPKPLLLLAHGDSWFDYPLNGNTLAPHTTDIIAQLENMGTVRPVILNLAHYGDSSSDAMALPKQQRLIAYLQDATNWVNGKPDAILFSGGGNDIAGDKFCIFLDDASTGISNGLDPLRFPKLLQMVEASYLDLFAFRDKYAPGVPIFSHCYDFAIPSGVHPVCAGPWLLPSLTYSGWTTAQGTAIVHQALAALATTLRALAAVPANNFILVETQGALATADWANELHPYPAGFKKIAARFVSALGQRFPGHI
ncbi:hypothetical protein LT85_4707 [Collimonas arenae]|uniref:Uncharacterized protein n=1 Tax=Collimonas arenae TaxID=279058 RepID=A0A0A1FJH1_9BURK|nr:SGNH/GDSL hydrolase family protein [Collimonas arenae]AIY43865.1 hypothetical protein LT85_4707 [Collimonas arenae]